MCSGTDGSVRRWAGNNLSVLFSAMAVLIAGCSEMPDIDEPVMPQTITFDATEVGGLPRDFLTALTGGGGPISWVVREDASAPDGKFILVQESADDTSYRFPLCIYEKTRARDVAVEVKYKAIAGKVDEAGGIVLRYRPENYYIARANALENNVILFKTVNGKRSKMVEVPARVDAGQWHTLRFEAKKAHLSISFDGRIMIEIDDDTFSNPGKVGLWTKADSVSAFTDFRIEPAR
jgi:hypothetical protein